LKKTINKKDKKINQTEIKRTMTKMNMKNKLKDTFVFYQWEEREKRRRRKKFICVPPRPSTVKISGSHFQRHRGWWCLSAREACTHHLPLADIYTACTNNVFSLTAVKYWVVFMNIIVIVFKNIFYLKIY
jgi:hypothetical protein